ncbi:scopoletin glucosyltransferase-like [Durio zibethinus]|uniref:Glycosyltransferase n=1 Tax=Durio zibethinus TaxID=66656 RepID=A0A6P6ANT2_DURZI|nr:scopoletin glucosyltransferase-like [Durio zibethinus]
MGTEDENKIHAMFLPYMAPGHMMPMVDMARRFAAIGTKVTIIITTMNALRIKNAIDRDIKSGRQITLEIISLPSTEVGLPEGCENMISVPTPEMSIKLFHAIELLQPQIEKLFRDFRPDCIVSDCLFPWSLDVANELGIPRIAFNGSGFFNLCVADSISRYEPHKNIKSETETFVVPGLPDEIILTRSQLPDIVKARNNFSELFDRLKESERKSFGLLMNSFYELEPAYADHCRKVLGIKAWHIGPVSLFNRDTDDQVERGEKASVSKHQCLSWLDCRNSKSVLYICFGSLTRFSKNQTTEIAHALEASGYSFIWVVGKVLKTKNDDCKDQEQELWLPEGFEHKMKENGQGLIIRGWAPQVLILEHPAIGGYLTHCGWNSILEGVTAGVPLITWPIFAEQFYNEKLVTQVLNLGVAVGNEVWKAWATEDSTLVKSKDDILKAINAVMGNTEKATEMSKRAKRLGELAKKAIEEGNSSYNDMIGLIEDIRLYKTTNGVSANCDEGAKMSSIRKLGEFAKEK